jgi:hypothetical protein
MLHASACAVPGALLEFAIQSLCRRLVVRCVRFGYPRSGKIVAPAIGYFTSMSASEIYEIRPGCLMLPPLHFPVRVWRADGSREAAVWTGKDWWAGEAIEPVRWQEISALAFLLEAICGEANFNVKREMRECFV